MTERVADIIQSPHNLLIKRIRSLGSRKTRHAERAFVLEGMRAFSAAVDAGIAPEVVFIAEDAADDLFKLTNPYAPRIIARKLFDQVMDTESPQGIAAIFPMPESPFPEAGDQLIVVLDSIGDPGNLGTIIRTAAAAGADGVVLGPGCVDPFNPKAVRAAMGALFAIPIWEHHRFTESWLVDSCPTRLLADGAGEVSYDAAVWQGSVAIIIGSEAHGATAWGRSLATARIQIPLTRQVESLNASIAAGILLFEAQRQRRVS
jgi:TrmH family RNA methyltransferase